MTYSVLKVPLNPNQPTDHCFSDRLIHVKKWSNYTAHSFD